MLYDDKKFPKDIQNIVDNVEKEVKIKVLDVKKWVLPVNKYNIEVEVTKEAPLNIIEEFILKIVLKYKGTGIYINENLIEEIMSINKVFILDSINKLLISKSIEYNESKYICITTIGEEQLKNGKALTYNKTENIELFIQPDFTLVYPKVESSNNLDVMKTNSDPNIDADTINSNHLFIRKIIEMSKKGGKILEDRLIGQSVNRISNVNIIEKNRFGEYIVLWLYDILENKIFCRVWDNNSKMYVKELNEYVMNYIPFNTEGFNTDLLEQAKDIENLTDMRIANTYEEKFKENLKIEEKDSSIRQLRGSEIKGEFNKCLKSAKKYIYIQSPWISEEVVDEEMIRDFEMLVNKGCKIFISWGINTVFENETRRPSEKLIKRLKNIKSSNGMQGLFIYWIGNHHNKEIVVDDKKHLQGSFNWLSYRGDYLFRGESVYLCSKKSEIIKAKKYFEEQIYNKVCGEIEDVKYEESINALINLQELKNEVNKFMKEEIIKLLKNDDIEKIYSIVSVYSKNRMYDEVFEIGMDKLIYSDLYEKKTIEIVNKLKNEGIYNKYTEKIIESGKLNQYV